MRERPCAYYSNNIPGFWNSRCKGPEARMCLAVGVAAKGLVRLEWNECGWRGREVEGDNTKEVIARSC